VAGNAIFSATPLSGTMTDEHDNVSAPVANAASYVVRPSKVLGEMDFFPISSSALHGAVVDLSKAGSDVEYDRDFNGTLKDFTYRGAYQGEGQNPGFLLDDTFKPMTDGGAGGSAGAGGSGGGSAGASSGGGSGTAGSGGASGSGAAGSGALGGTGGSTGGASGTQAAASGEDSGCACASAPRGAGRSIVGIGLLTALLLRRNERRRLRTRASAD
jgi:hypothetical protein